MTANLSRSDVLRPLIGIASVLAATFLTSVFLKAPQWALISEAVVTETVFALPGIGQLVVQSILRRDYPVIQGIILVTVVLYLAVNLLVDLSYRFLDPRVELQ